MPYDNVFERLAPAALSGLGARRQLMDLLLAYRPMDARDAENLAKLGEFVMREELCFERSLRPGHITGSAWLLSPDERSVLLTHHRKLGRWLQLGGHADGHPDVLEVALREAREESGIPDITPYSRDIFDLDIHDIPERPGEPTHLHYDLRFVLKARTDLLTVSDESIDLRWVPIEEIPAFSDSRSVTRMRDKWLMMRSGRSSEQGAGPG